MRPADIRVGKTYCNRGAGRTRRTVLDISDVVRPSVWFSDSQRPNEPGVLYVQNGKQERLYLSSFASWAGCEVQVYVSEEPVAESE